MSLGSVGLAPRAGRAALATTDSRIWVVPPAMLRHLLKAGTHAPRRAAAPSLAAPSGPHSTQRGLRDRLPVRHAHQLAHRRPVRRRPPRPAAQRRAADPSASRRGHRRSQRPDLLRHAWIGGQPRVSRPRRASPSTASPSAEPRPMAIRSAASVLLGYLPAVPGGPDDAVVGDESLAVGAPPDRITVVSGVRNRSVASRCLARPHNRRRLRPAPRNRTSARPHRARRRRRKDRRRRV